MAEVARHERYTLDHFQIIKELGKGAFGKICLVKEKKTQIMYALKAQSKSFLIEEDQLDNIKAEREILAQAEDDWIIKMYYSFQDEKFIYEILEFCPGGDFFALLVREDRLPESSARFYIAELCAAISCVHQLGFSHRDVKPDNLLIDTQGHLKLSDFGLSKKVKRNVQTDYSGAIELDDNGKLKKNSHDSSQMKNVRRRRQLMNSLVGTPDYVAIEILKNSGYDKNVDWWSVGVIFYECLMGYPPFYADDVNSVCRKIINYPQTLVIPDSDEYDISEEAKDLIFSLIIVPEKRLSFPKIREHPFFKSISWDNLRDQTPPFIPELDSPEDTRYFDLEEDENADKDPNKNPELMFQLNEYQPRSVRDSSKFQDFTFVRRDLKPKRTGLDSLFDEIDISDEEPEDPPPKNASHRRQKTSITEGGIEIFGATGVNKELINGRFLPHKILKHEGHTVWKRIDLALVLWFWSKRGIWMLTREKDLGTDRVYCVVKCGYPNPSQIDDTFYVWNPTEKKLLADNQVKVGSFSLELFE